MIMTEINDMDLMYKMLQAMGMLRRDSFQRGGAMSFGSRAGQPSFDGQQAMFGGPSFGSAMGGRSSMNGGPAMNGWSMPGNGAMQMGPQGHSMNGHRPGFVRENLLTIIAQAPKGIRAKEIARQAGINQSSVSESLTKLEDDGYIKRQPDPDDKRATLIFLTELGKARASEVQDEQTALFGHLFDSLTADEKAELLRLLNKIIDGHRN